MRQQLTILCLLTVLLSSCFEIIEDITLNRDGSGSIRLLVNLNQSKAEINTLMKLDSSSAYRIPDQKIIGSKLDKLSGLLVRSEGISEVKIKKDFREWVFELSASFKNTDCLEKSILAAISGMGGDKSVLKGNKLHFDGSIFERRVPVLDAETLTMANRSTEKRVLSGAKYTAIYRFSEPVIGCTNSRAKIAASQKAVMIQANILNLINGKESISNTIKLK